MLTDESRTPMPEPRMMFYYDGRHPVVYDRIPHIKVLGPRHLLW